MSPPPRNTAATTRRSPVAFAATAYVLAVLLVGPNVPTPLYPTYRQAFGFSPLTVTLIYAVYAGTLIPSLLLFGPLSDALGRRRVLYWALALAAAGAVLLAYAQGTGWLFLGRMLQGVSIGAGSGAASAALRETEPSDNRTRAAIAASAAMVGGSAVGPVLAGVLVQYAPAPRHLSYLVYLVLLGIGAVALSALHEPRPTQTWKPQRPGVPAHMRVPFAIAGATAFLVWAVTALFLALIPSFVAGVLHTPNTAVSGAVVTAMLAGSALVQLCGRSWPALRVQITGLVVVVAGLAVLNAAGYRASVTLLLVAAVVAGVGQGMAFLGAMKEVNLNAPPARLAEVISGFYVVVYLGVGVPIIGVGVLATHVGLLTAVREFSLAVGVIGIALAAVLALYARRRTAHPASSDPDERTHVPPPDTSIPPLKHGG
ncbi:MFS transporter [Streptomyces sp. SID3343]|uniref:MFS transporter n=1 Tax=Streptomyces sp. SID3343 TaxID=2690260 RepID=UPI00136A0AB2|nr:MFS transporter [Streptomyces sp. SID3343]MYW04947.1 MFS transporter [Streptomyces sp. SID3343]